MFKELVEKKCFCFHDSFTDWETSIHASCQPLLDIGVIEECYVDAIISCIHKYGPYIVLAPNIAMPHSTQGAQGVHGTQISFMRVANPVSFEDGNPDKEARIYFVLASINHQEHMKQMMQLADLLANNELVQACIDAENINDLLAIDEKFNLAIG